MTINPRLDVYNLQLNWPITQLHPKKKGFLNHQATQEYLFLPLVGFLSSSSKLYFATAMPPSWFSGVNLMLKFRGTIRSVGGFFSNLDLIYEQFTQNAMKQFPSVSSGQTKNNLTIFRLSLKRQKGNQPLKSCKQKNSTVSPTYLLEKRFFPNRWWWATGHLLGSQPPSRTRGTKDQ